MNVFAISPIASSLTAAQGIRRAHNRVCRSESPLGPHNSALAWSLYKYAALWRAVSGPSATERSLGSIREEKGISARFRLYLVAIWPKAGVPHRACANDMVMFFSSQIRRYGKVAIDLSTKVRQFKLYLYFGGKNEKSNSQMKCRMRK